ncbi:MAG: VWA domain-containing protein [Deltaproteobacteria bacterium]|nr:VWA domain-containing protein [Deltaproteobacteria bacterium]
MPSPRDPADAPLGGAEMLTPDGRSLPFAGATLRIEAGAGIARVVLEQTFENPFEETLRVTYKMPLPVDGAVSGYAFRIGSRTVTGKVDRKERARERFEEAIVQGRTAALLEQDKADLFTQEIGNVPPKQTIRATITIDQRLAWKPEGEWELRFPTVIGPRYLEAHLGAADRKASHVEVAEEGGVRARIRLEAKIVDTLTTGRAVESPSHALSARPDGIVELRDPAGARLDRDIVLRWSVAQRDVGLELQIARPEASAPHARHAYGVLSVVPPAPDAGHASVPRDLIVLLDTSGSMEGGPLEQGKRVVAMLIESLTERDRLEVIEFSMAPNRFTSSPVPGTKREKERAIHWVMSRRANGGTEMQSAIYDALKGLRKGAQRQVVLVTDGYVGGEEQLVALLHESLPESCRMHVVGVGSGVNRALATSIARAGRGAELLVGLDDDAERCAKALVDKTRAPVLTDVTITGDALVEHAPEHVPDVFAGSPIALALKLSPAGGEITVRGNMAAGVWSRKVRVPAIDPGEGNAAIVALFGREQVADLEVRWTIGKETRLVDEDIERIGVVFQIATRRTSWVAIDEDRTVDPRRGTQHVEVPQELPYGTSAQSFGLAAPSYAPVVDALRAMPLAASAPLALASMDRYADAAGAMPEDDEEASMVTSANVRPSAASFATRDEGAAYGGPPSDEERATLPPPPAQSSKGGTAPPPPPRAAMPAPTRARIASTPAPMGSAPGGGASPPGAPPPLGAPTLGAPPAPPPTTAGAPEAASLERRQADPTYPSLSMEPRAAAKRSRRLVAFVILLVLAFVFGLAALLAKLLLGL